MPRLQRQAHLIEADPGGRAGRDAADPKATVSTAAMIGEGGRTARGRTWSGSP